MYSPATTTPGQDYARSVNDWYAQGLIDAQTRDSYLADIRANPNSEVTAFVPLTAVGLVPGKYTATSYLLWKSNSSESNLIISEKRQSICAGINAGICIGGHRTVVYPAQNYSTWVSGGGVLNFTLTENDVYNDKSVTFYALEMPFPRTWDMLEHYQSIEDYQQGKVYLLRPRIE